MSMTLCTTRGQLRHESVLREVEYILDQRLWTPLYEEGGMDALVQAGEIRPPNPCDPLPPLDHETVRR